MKNLNIVWGKVKIGKKRGKALGFPTANIILHKKIPSGIYASLTKIGEKTYRSVAFIGKAETFNEIDYKAETSIFDFNRNIYGKWISIRLLKKIRDSKKFASEKKLIEQIKKDVLTTRKFFQKSF